MAKIQQTCKDCKERHLGCHSDCVRYLAAKTELAVIREKEFQELMKDKRYRDFRSDMAEKAKRSHRSRKERC